MARKARLVCQGGPSEGSHPSRCRRENWTVSPRELEAMKKALGKILGWQLAKILERDGVKNMAGA